MRSLGSNYPNRNYINMERIKLNIQITKQKQTQKNNMKIIFFHTSHGRARQIEHKTCLISQNINKLYNYLYEFYLLNSSQKYFFYPMQCQPQHFILLQLEFHLDYFWVDQVCLIILNFLTREVESIFVFNYQLLKVESILCYNRKIESIMQNLLPFTSINCLKVEILTEKDVNETSELLNKQFIQRNPLWINSKVDKNESLHIVKQRVRRGLEDSLSFGLFVDGKQVMNMIALDLKKLLNGKFKIDQIYQWQHTLQKVYTHLSGKYFQTHNILQGQYIFGDLGATTQDYDKSISCANFWVYCMLIYKHKGYKGLFGHTTNPVALKLIYKIGGTSVMTEIIECQGNNKNRIDLIYVDFSKLEEGMVPRL